MYRREIDGLRAFAVVPVVLFHAGVPGFSGGYVGVDIFFVISGFLITSIIWRETQDGTFSIVNFYERRARRILPALGVVVFVSLIAGWIVQTPGAFKDTAEEAVSTALFASNIYYFYFLDYFATAAEMRLLLHTWSLAVEEQFYILWPLVLLAFAAIAHRGFRFGVTLVFGVSFVLAVVITPRFPQASFYLLPTRAWELMTGAILALRMVPPLRQAALREVASLAGLAMILAAVVLYDETTIFPGMAALLPCVGAALVLHTGGSTWVGRLLALSPFVFVGLISYSFYLWHWPPLALARTVAGSADLPVWLGIATSAAAFGVAILSWRYIERPFRNRTRIGARTVFVLSGATLSGLFVMSLAIVVANGVPGRYDARAIALYQEALTTADHHCESRLPRDGLCRIGNTDGVPSVLVWGDSHARALLPAMDIALAAAGLDGVAAVHLACLPLPGARRASGHDSCIQFTEAVASMLDAPNQPIDTVIIVGRWALNVEGTRAPGEAGAPVRLVADDSVVQGNAGVVRHTLTNLVEHLRARGIRVVFLGDVPEIGWNVADRVLMASKLPTLETSGPMLSDVDARGREANSILADLAMHEGVDLVPIAPILCRPQCETVRDGRSLYKDDDHLSTFGASLVGPALGRAIFGVSATEVSTPSPLKRPLYKGFAS